MVSGMGVFSGCVCVVDGYGLELMAFYMFICLVLRCMLRMNFGTGQRARELDILLEKANNNIYSITIFL